MKKIKSKYWIKIDFLCNKKYPEYRYILKTIMYFSTILLTAIIKLKIVTINYDKNFTISGFYYIRFINHANESNVTLNILLVFK